MSLKPRRRAGFFILYGGDPDPVVTRIPKCVGGVAFRIGFCAILRAVQRAS